MKLLFSLGLILLGFGGPGWTTDFSKAQQQAAQEHKMILLNFSGSDWCIPCIKMHKEIFDSPEFTQFANDHLVLVNADFPRSKKNALSAELLKANEKLAEQYNSKGSFPLTLLLDAEGHVIKSWDGYKKTSPSEFVAQMQSTANAH